MQKPIQVSELGEKIRERRKALNITQPMLAEMTNIPQGQISRYENGLSEPVASNVLAIAQALQVSTDWLLGLEEYPADLPHHYGELNEQEQQMLREFRNKSPERQRVMIEIVRMAN